MIPFVFLVSYNRIHDRALTQSEEHFKLAILLLVQRQKIFKSLPNPSLEICKLQNQLKKQRKF